MAKKNTKNYSRFSGGLADFDNESLVPNGFAWARSIDIRTNPQEAKLLPKTIKESGTTVTDLPQWGDIIPTSGVTYLYGNTGNIYTRSTAASYSLLRTVPNSHGNGMSYFAEDDFVYYTSDKVIGRYGPLGGTPTASDDYLGAAGGVPLNTFSLDLESSSSQYASRADTASLSITGNLALEAYIRPESLPTVGNTMTLVSKWNQNGNIRSYKFDIAAISGYFGDGSDGALTISSNTTEAPVDSACTGTIATTTLTATNASFVAGQQIYIHQSQGTGAGTWQRTSIAGYTAGTITTADALNATYGTGAQVRVLKQYSAVTVNSGITYTAKAWNGTVGGILAFLCSGTVTVTGNISANGTGYRGGTGSVGGQQGEGTAGDRDTVSTAANGNGGGGGGDGGPSNHGSGGGGGSGTAGANGGTGSIAGIGGSVVGTADLTTMVFGGGGGVGLPNGQGAGGTGGGIIFGVGTTITVTGGITATGNNGSNNSGGGGGAGSVLLKAQTATLGTVLITGLGGTGGTGDGGANPVGGVGGVARIHLDYYTSYTGTTSPTLDYGQDNNLVTSTSYQLRFAVSSNGTAFETLARSVALTIATWQHVAVSWVASTSIATFYLNAISQGTSTGTITAISDNASAFQIGMDQNSAGTAINFYDGLIDEVRLWNTTRTVDQFLANKDTQIATNSTGLAAYYKLNNAYTDATVNANTLTATGSPVFSVTVPFSSPTTRQDIDQETVTTGFTYTTPVTPISEVSTDLKTFTPGKDPQKSVAVLVAAVGTGAWTLTVHDAQNNVVASKTITNANMTTGYVEFTFASVWRPLTNFTNIYHFHLTSTVADGTVTTGVANDLSTVSFKTYYQFLVESTDWHPIARFLQFLVFGNERYIAKLEATLYEPNKITLPAGWKTRCFGYWNEYLAIGVTRGTSITSFDSGRIYFWDGAASTYNFYIEIPEGGVNALLGVQDKLYIWAGYQGDMLVYQGGSTTTKIKRVLKVAADKYMEVFPGAVNMWKTLIRFGVAGNSDSSVIEKGVYTWGHVNFNYPDILTYDYPISTGNRLSTVKIGLIIPVNKKLLIGWQDNISYGVDCVDAGNAVYSNGTIEFLIDDDQAKWHQKQANTLVAMADLLNTGESVTTKYKVDNATSWTSNVDAAQTVDNVSITTQTIPDGRYYQVQVAVDLATTGSTSPILNGVGLEVDQNLTEEKVGK